MESSICCTSRLMLETKRVTSSSRAARCPASAGVILPKELLARQRLEKGDELFALETP